MADYFERSIEPSLQRAFRHFPIVTLLGPRQSGKTTLVRHMFPDLTYVNFELMEVREAAMLDPRAFLRRHAGGAIFDEVQRIPELLSFIQVMVDEDRRPGRFVLTGSHQLSLHAAIAQSLAGRTAMLQLLPLSLLELSRAGIRLNADQAMLYGGYPGLYLNRLQARETYSSYLQTYVERDVRQILQIHDLLSFQKFIRLLAGRVGQLVNLEGLSNEVGVSSPTIKSWLSVLEASFLIYRLPPYFENFGKRLTKSPKLYFTDVGLAVYLLGVESTAQLERDPLRGNLFENLVVMEIVKAFTNQGREPRCYFLQDSKRHEIDLVTPKGSQLVPMEIKSGETFRADFLKNMEYFRSIVKADRMAEGYVWYGGAESYDIRGIHVRPYHEAGLSVISTDTDEPHPCEN
ncbi:MAG: ATP-binding protein [Chlamydiia bacterium]